MTRADTVNAGDLGSSPCCEHEEAHVSVPTSPGVTSATELMGRQEHRVMAILPVQWYENILAL